MVPRRLFVSYSRKDSSACEVLTTDLTTLGHQVWKDSKIRLGEPWWANILEEIRAADGFIVALSPSWILSEHCRMEHQYAQALGKSILPIVVGELGPYDTWSESARHQIDYSQRTPENALRLAAGLDRLNKSRLLTGPLPEPPSVPYTRLAEISERVAAPELTLSDQALLVLELKRALRKSKDDNAAHEVQELMLALNERPDLRPLIATELRELLEQRAFADQPPRQIEEPAPRTSPPATRDTLLPSAPRRRTSSLYDSTAPVELDRASREPSRRTVRWLRWTAVCVWFLAVATALGLVFSDHNTRARIREALRDESAQPAPVSSATRPEPVPAHLLPDFRVVAPPPLAALDLSASPARGPLDAFVTLLVLCDLRSEECAELQGVLDRVVRSYGDRVRVVFKPLALPLINPESWLRSEAAWAAHQQDKFWQMRDRLFADAGELSFDAMLHHARALGLNMDQFASALLRHDHGSAVRADLELAKELSVDGSPACFLNGTRVEPELSYDAIASVVEHVLSESGPSVAKAPMLERLVSAGTLYPFKGRANAKAVVDLFGRLGSDKCLEDANVLRLLLDPDTKLVWHPAPASIAPLSMQIAQAAMIVFQQAGNDAFWTYYDQLCALGANVTPRDLEHFALQLPHIDPVLFARALDARSQLNLVFEDLQALSVTRAGSAHRPVLFVNTLPLDARLPWQAALKSRLQSLRRKR